MSSAEGVSTGERVRHVLAENRSLVVGACLLVALVGGVLAYGSLTGPQTTTEQQTAGTWTVDSEFRHGAVVRRDTRAFPAGTVLRNRSVYVSSVAPVLNGTYVVRHDGDAEPATVRTDLRLVVRAVEGQGEEETVLWRVSEPVAAERTESLRPGSAFAVPYQFNVTRQSELAERVRAELDSSRGRVQVRLVASTTVAATVAGEEFDERRTESLEVVPRGGSYSVELATDGERRETVRETVTVPVEPDPVVRYGGLLALVAGLCGAGGVAYLDRRGRLAVDPDTRAAVATASDRESFAEWISTGQVPPAGDERVVVVESLADLVDVAIDSERRVIEDRETGTFVVLDDTARYVFRPATGPRSTALEAGGDPLSEGRAAGRSPSVASPGGARSDGTGDDEALGDEVEADGAGETEASGGEAEGGATGDDGGP